MLYILLMVYLLTVSVIYLIQSLYVKHPKTAQLNVVLYKSNIIIINIRVLFYLEMCLNFVLYHKNPSTHEPSF